MKPGDRVRHKLAEIELTVVRISESVAVCRRDEPINSKFGYEIWTALCAIENLELISEKQLNLF